MIEMQPFWGLFTPAQIRLSYLSLAIAIIGWLVFLGMKKRKKISLPQVSLLLLTCFLFVSLLTYIGELKGFGSTTKEFVDSAYNQASEQISEDIADKLSSTTDKQIKL